MQRLWADFGADMACRFSNTLSSRQPSSAAPAAPVMAAPLLVRQGVNLLVLLAFAAWAESTPPDAGSWPVPVAECLLALETESAVPAHPHGGSRSLASIQRHRLQMRTDCGGDRRPRTRCSAECLGLCVLEGSFLPRRGRQVVFAGAMGADRSELWLVEHHGRGYRKISTVAIPEGEPVLIPANMGRSFAETQARIDGISIAELPLDGPERVCLFILIWRPVPDGWEGALYGVLVDARTGALELRYVLALEAGDARE
jgi:hypothetical protein